MVLNPVLAHKGRPPSVAAPLVFNTLSIVGNTLSTAGTPGTLIGTISSKTVGSTLSVTDPRVAIAGGNQLVIGLTPATAGAFDVDVTETLAGYTTKISTVHLLASDPGGAFDVGNNGTQVVPGGAVNVANTSQLATAISGRGTNTVIKLAAGDYGSWNFNSANYNGLTLIGGAGVRFKDIAISGSNITLSYLDLYKGQDGLTIPAGQYSVVVSNCNNVNLDHLYIQQGNVMEARCTAIFVRDVHDVTITHCDLFKVGNGINGQGDVGDGSDCYNINIDTCSISNYVENGGLFQHAGNITLRRIRVRTYDLSSGGHADSWQLTSITKIGAGLLDTPSGDSVACIVEDCYAEAAIGFHDPSGFLGQVADVVGGMKIRRICNWGVSFQGLGLGGLVGGPSLIDNTFCQSITPFFSFSRVLVRGQSDNVTLTNNFANSFETTDTPAPTNLTPPIAQWTQPTAPTGNTKIAMATDVNDTGARDAFLAAHTTIPHW